MSAVEVVNTVSDPNATDFSVGEKLAGVGAALITGIALSPLEVPALTIAGSVAAGYVAKQAWDAFTESIGFTEQNAQPFWKTVLGNLGLSSTDVQSNSLPSALQKSVPGLDGSTILQLNDADQTILFLQGNQSVTGVHQSNGNYAIDFFTTQGLLTTSADISNQGTLLDQRVYQPDGSSKENYYDAVTGLVMNASYFDSKGNLTESDSYVYDGGKLKTVTQLDASGKTLSVTQYDSNQQIITKESFAYDASGKLISTVTTDANGNLIGNQPISTGPSTSPTTAPSPFHTTIVGQDSNGHPTVIKHYDSSGNDVGGETLTYDASGHIVGFRIDSSAYSNTTALTQTPQAGTWFEAQWNSDGTLSGLIAHLSNGTVYRNVSVVYHNDGSRSMQILGTDGVPLLTSNYNNQGGFTSSQPPGTLAHVDYNTLPGGGYTLDKYNDNGQHVQTDQFGADGNEVQQTIYNYANGVANGKTVVNFIKDSNGYRNSTTYDTTGRVVETARIGDGNVKVSTTTYIYNTDGSHDEVQKDSMGNVTFQQHFTPDGSGQDALSQFNDAQGHLHVKITHPDGKYVETVHANQDPRSAIVQQVWIDKNGTQHNRVALTGHPGGFQENYIDPKLGPVTLLQFGPGQDVVIATTTTTGVLPPGASAIGFDLNSMDLSSFLRPIDGQTSGIGLGGIVDPGSIGYVPQYVVPQGTDVSNTPGSPQVGDPIITLPDGSYTVDGLGLSPGDSGDGGTVNIEIDGIGSTGEPPQSGSNYSARRPQNMSVQQVVGLTADQVQGLGAGIESLSSDAWSVFSSSGTTVAKRFGGESGAPLTVAVTLAPAINGGVTLHSGQSIVAGGMKLAMQTDGNLVIYDSTNNAVWSTGTADTINQGAYLAMQPDGNLVIYRPTGEAIWESDTADHAGEFLVFASDGSLSLQTESRVNWLSSAQVAELSGAQVAELSATPTQALGANIQSLSSDAWKLLTTLGSNTVKSYGGEDGAALTSAVVLRPDANGAAALASGQSITTGGTKLAMQADGNLVIYDPAGKAIWSSGTSADPANAGAYLHMQPDGNLVIYRTDGHPIWSSGTNDNAGEYLVFGSDGTLSLQTGSRLNWLTTTEVQDLSIAQVTSLSVNQLNTLDANGRTIATDLGVSTNTAPASTTASSGSSNLSVANLVQSMAAFAPTTAGTSSLIPDQQRAVHPVFAPNLH